MPNHHLLELVSSVEDHALEREVRLVDHVDDLLHLGETVGAKNRQVVHITMLERWH